MKRLFAVAIVAALLLAGCAVKYRTDITHEEIVTAYEEAGYEVSSKIYDDKLDYGQIGYVQADHPDGDYIYFYIFETEKEAKAYKEEFHHPVMTGLFSVIYGQPSWQRMEVYGCVLVEYDQPEHASIFEQLVKAK